jgi:initiation factor 1A
MVKNTHGGNKHKGFARKHTTAKAASKLRLAQEGELYAIVTKMCGNNMFQCHCIDDVLRLGYIRGKFSGRGKRDNMIVLGTWVLVGLRDWDTTEAVVVKKDDKLQKCDLLEVYSEIEKDRLKDTTAEDWNKLIANDLSKVTKTEVEDDFIEFSNTRHEERSRLLEEISSGRAEMISLNIEDTDTDDKKEEEINIDDI